VVTPGQRVVAAAAPIPLWVVATAQLAAATATRLRRQQRQPPPGQLPPTNKHEPKPCTRRRRHARCRCEHGQPFTELQTNQLVDATLSVNVALATNPHQLLAIGVVLRCAAAGHPIGIVPRRGRHPKHGELGLGHTTRLVAKRNGSSPHSTGQWLHRCSVEVVPADHRDQEPHSGGHLVQEIHKERTTIARVLERSPAGANSNEHKTGLTPNLREQPREVRVRRATPFEVMERIHDKSAVNCLSSAAIRLEDITTRALSTTGRR